MTFARARSTLRYRGLGMADSILSSVIRRRPRAGLSQPSAGPRSPSETKHALITRVLVRVNPENPASTTDFVCDVCTEIPEPADGGRTYAFPIREDVRFQDGSTAIRTGSRKTSWAQARSALRNISWGSRSPA